jgi:hypothetical protein
MTSKAIIGAAVAIFVVAALLYFQSHPAEGFEDIDPSHRNPTASRAIGMLPPQGRWYGANSDVAYDEPVPADLNKAPTAIPATLVPTSHQRPVAIPGPGTAPKEAMAQRKDLYQLDNNISVWLNAASQREVENPGSLTPQQTQRRIMLQARLADVRQQLGTGMITDTYRAVSQDILDLRRENAGWKEAAPSLDEVHAYASGENPEEFLTAEKYTEFRRLYNAALHQYKSFIQPDPLQKIRLQQLQIMLNDLNEADKLYKPHPPPIKYGAAQMFLKQMLRPDQPLPTLFAMEPNPALQKPTHAASPADIIGQLKDIQWRLTVTYNPAEQELKRAIASLLDRLESGVASRQELDAARNQLAALQARHSPVAAIADTPGMMPVRTHVPAPSCDSAPIRYDPKNLQARARVLCQQIREAFPQDAAALGCPTTIDGLNTEYEAESVINTVCDRLRFSVPSVTPEQFNCPPRAV